MRLLSRRAAALVAAAALAGTVPVATAATPALPGSKDVEAVWSQPGAASASSVEFFEREVAGKVVRYAAVGVMGHGVQFYDVTDPARALPVGLYASPGVSYHTDVRINHERDILVMNVDSPGATVAQGIGPGIEFVDIKDPAAAKQLGVVPGLEGPHKLALIGDRHVYTTLPTFIIDYTDPTKPKNLGRTLEGCGHAFTVDPNDPNVAYAGSCSRFKWIALDVSDPARPKVISETPDTGIDVPHEAVPSPDSTFVAVSDLRADYAQTTCPGGGIHFYDISGKYTSPDAEGPASRSNPIKMGQWFPPFSGVSTSTSSTGPWASCTAHGLTMHPERVLLSDAHYAAGGWLLDPRRVNDGSGPYTEYSAKPSAGLGPTTWGTTLANWTVPGNQLWYLEWAPFDDPAYDRLLFGISPDRGLDVVRHTGPVPGRTAGLDVAVADGQVTGTLLRRPLLTPDGYVRKPLAGQTVTVTAGGASATAVTGEDGSFSVPVPGSGPVTVRWPGDDDFEPATATAG
ncbi:MAG TPA: hypothetical protein VNU26_03585 [Mycobacteriales bacterium]|nr:hypothetical protein [Mycobacteriales bacterium]